VAQYSFENCPPAIESQVLTLVGAMESSLRENLIGIYLHGSLAMGCFNPAISDLDLLAVTRRSMPPQTKRAIAELLLRYSLAPIPVEIILLRQVDFTPWQYPTPFDFHYSEMWRERFIQDLQTGEWQSWNRRDNYDQDLSRVSKELC
jgi:streptomycin 3"-adenylyltransferase